MSVIKQKRQVFNRPIGVIRADTGSEQIYRGMKNLADNLIETSFNDMKRIAKEEGKELAQSKAIESLRTINPITGLPEAYKAPENFGTVAQEAYERVVQQRFVSIVENDFKQKASELAIKYQYDPDSVTKFEDSMNAYLQGYGKQSTDQKIDPRIQNIITSMGSQLLASNKLNLMSKQQDRQRADTLADFGLNFQSGLNNIEQLYSTTASEQDGKFYIDASNAYLQDMIDSGLIKSPTQINAYRMQIMNAQAKGLARQIESAIVQDEGVNSVTLIKAEQVIRNNGNGIEELPENVQKQVRKILDISLDGKPVLNQVLPSVEAYFNDANANFRGIESAERQVEADLKAADREADVARKEADRAGINENFAAFEKDTQNFLSAGDFEGAKNRYVKYESDINNTTLGDPTKRLNLKNGRNMIIAQTIEQANIPPTGQDAPTVEEMETFRTYLNTRGRTKLGNMPQYLQTIADNVLDISSPAEDRTIISTMANSEYNIVSQRAKADAKREKDLKDFNTVSRMSGNSSIKDHREAMDKIVLGDKDASYLLTPDSLEDDDLRKSVIGLNVLPQAMYDLGEQYMNGGLSQQQEIIFLQHYANYRNALNPRNTKGEFLNMWRHAGFNAKDIGMIDAVLAGASVSPNGIMDATQIRVRMMEFRNDPDKFNAALRTAFKGQTIQEFVDEVTTTSPTFGFDYANPNVTAELIPYVEYFVANGIGKDKIKANLENFMEEYYAETDGIVVDLPFGSVRRSRNSFKELYPLDADRDLAVGFINEALSDIYGTDNIVRRGDMKDVDIGRLHLQPFPMSGTSASGNNIRYMVMQRNEQGAYSPFISNGQMVAFERETIDLYVNELKQPTGNPASAYDKAKRDQMRKNGVVYTDQEIIDMVAGTR